MADHYEYDQLECVYQDGAAVSVGIDHHPRRDCLASFGQDGWLLVSTVAIPRAEPGDVVILDTFQRMLPTD